MTDSAAIAKSDPAFAQAHADLLKHTDLQFAFPGFDTPKVPDWLKALGQFLQTNAVPIKWGFWIVAGLIVLGVAIVLVRQFWPLLMQRPWRTARTVEPVSDWRPTVAEARRLLQESDALAAQGLYSEAVHLLLLRSIEDIEERRPRLVRPTLTSREIGRLQGLPDAARAAFAGIARVVERALFAGDSIGAAEFARCRQDYEAFALAPVWRA